MTVETTKPDAKVKKPRKTRADKEKEAPADVSVPMTAARRSVALGRLVHLFYDYQRLRMQTGGRVVGDQSEIVLHPKHVDMLNELFEDTKAAEARVFNQIKKLLKDVPFYAQVLSDKKKYKGLGPTMACVILSEFKIERADTVSKMWAYAGLRPMPAHRCRFCNSLVVLDKGCDLDVPELAAKATFTHAKGTKCVPYVAHPGAVPVPGTLAVIPATQVYVSGKAQRPTKGEKLPYNAWLRSKLIGVLGPCLLKCNSPWRKFYDDKKLYYQSKCLGVSDGHRHNMSMRYMVKMLLLDIYIEWRKIEGLPVRAPYSEAKLGHVHVPRPGEPGFEPPAGSEADLDEEIV